jgi:hypothetical protein
MPFPRSYLRHTILWSLPGGEVATAGCAWDNTGGGIIGTPTDIAAALAAKSLAMWNSIKGSWATGTAYVGSRTAVIAVSGLTVETVENGHAPVTGGHSSANLPTEVAVVASLRTATYSRSGRGRMYLPAPSTGAVEPDGRFLASTQGGLADAMQTYLSTVTVGAADYFPVIASKTQFALRPVTTVQVGDIFDSQRRRRDALTEVYLSRAVS